MNRTMVRTRGLTRHFTVDKQTVEAVRGLDLHIEAGETVALLGPNGAGKSTTLRMLTSLLPPTSGAAEVAGYDVVADPRAVRRRIGYIGQGNGAAHSQWGRDELISQGRAYGLTIPAARRRAAELIDSLDLSAVADRVVSTLSGGQRRRLDIAMGLIHSPALLFLDEPSTGLDPQNRANLQQHILDLRARHGTTVVLTTHYLAEADQLADRIVVIDHGRVIADDTPARLKSEHAGDRITLEFADVSSAERAATRARGLLSRGRVECLGPLLIVEAVGGTGLAPLLLRGMDEAGLSVSSVEVARPTLDDVFLTLTGRSLREDGSSVEATDVPARQAGVA
ncbi:ABC-2 type transport system ATP-binding protein [Actinoalloteichus hoggarensis]|uniref:Daunorubicin/doxorubicin resistance ATP-binding protein DrrA n=2 Tax=Actinoalloteichus hoggarensis TaxID=1470176 RepID=A0A221VZ84_9PSEU|nr:ATP-binding cassette domain-containing protein [Actinoalloteichus hoggarensis]ASO18800.1 Daunorubicin/doxorubicin resistance ATP-binding protein DrrA [Actinoalloteichus hoggarensis]MBB5920033.1 ABC-2 type transport system ATP-binding protein [Actinoalloteichus hoggarensis]